MSNKQETIQLASTSKTLLHDEQRFYDLRWQQSEIPARELRRVVATVQAIPAECKRILDVGAGDGRIWEQIRARGLQVTALDLSLVALARLSVPSCCGSADRLPFGDAAFDLVLSTEMLEHVPSSIYPRVLSELARVAGRYVLVTVPNRENLTEQQAKCGACGRTFHIWGHARAYTRAKVNQLFPGFQAIRISEIGDSLDGYNRLLLWVRQKLGGGFAWDASTYCYHCTASVPCSPRSKFLLKICDGLNLCFWAPFNRRPSWLLVLYRRNTLPIAK